MATILTLYMWKQQDPKLQNETVSVIVNIVCQPDRLQNDPKGKVSGTAVRKYLD